MAVRIKIDIEADNIALGVMEIKGMFTQMEDGFVTGIGWDIEEEEEAEDFLGE